jgi:PKD repeat protein
VVEVNNPVNFINNSINATSYLWDFGDSTTSTLTHPGHVYTTTGTYTVQLTAINGTGCDNWTEKRYYIKVINPVSVFEAGEVLNLSLYPNPVKDILHIENSTSQPLTATIFDLCGKKYASFELSHKNEINVTAMAPGMYFYQITNHKNILSVGKFVKE